MTGEETTLNRIAVMMSSFNGALYIEEQIRSILRQIGVNVTLFVRDDGSTDETVRILGQYASKGQAVVTYGENIGIGSSFMELLRTVPDDFDYYAFSDQDDIWQEDKLFAAVCRLKDVHGCALYVSNLECVDAENRSIGMRFQPDTAFDGSLLSVICRGRCYGCTEVFNRDLLLFQRQRLPSKEMLAIRLHDTWIAVSAAVAGRILYDNDSHIRYRRHNQNYTTFDRGTAYIWKQRLSKLFHREKRNSRSRTAQEVLQLYPESVQTDSDRDLICILAEPFHFAHRAALIKYRKHFLSVPGESETWFLLKVIAGLI